jgi:hypothetical protein
MAKYPYEYLFVGYRIIHLKHIESILLTRTADDLIVEKLQGDLVMQIHTISGADYDVSMLHQQHMFRDGFGDPATLDLPLAKLKLSIIGAWLLALKDSNGKAT